MKNVIYFVILFCCSALLVSADGCLDTANLTPTAIHTTVKFYQSLHPAEILDVFVEENLYQYECENSRLGKALSTIPLDGNVKKKYFLRDKIIITYNDDSTYEINKDQQHVTYIEPLRLSSYRNGTCWGRYNQTRNVSVVEFMNITLSIKPKTIPNKTSYVFHDVRVYTLSEVPLVQYALLGDDDYFLALHLKDPYNINTKYTNTEYNGLIEFNQHDNFHNNKSAKDFLRTYGTFQEKALKLMKDHCEIVVFQETINLQREKVDHTTIIIIFYGICVILSCLLNIWLLRRMGKMKNCIKKFEKAVLVLNLDCDTKKVAESPYEYIECLNKVSSEHGYVACTVKPPVKSKIADKESTSCYLTPVNSIRQLN